MLELAQYVEPCYDRLCDVGDQAGAVYSGSSANSLSSAVLELAQYVELSYDRLCDVGDLAGAVSMGSSTKSPW